MTLTVGTNTYVSEADADTYHTDRGNSTWTAATTADKEAALIKATDYLESKYKYRWKGRITDLEQVLAWPRSGAYDEEDRIFDNTEYPRILTYAVAEYALRALSDDILPDIAAGGQLKRKKTDVLEKEWNDWASPNKKYPYLEKMISGLLVDGGKQRLSRR